MSFSNTSKILTKRISSADKKGNGIYFTPPNIITKHLEILKPYLHDIKNILEPSCGSCEYIRALQNDNHTITGVELNDTVFDEISTTEYINTTLIHANFLEWEPPKNFDLIIGNPPYYVMKKDEMPHVYSPYYTGRPNIFGVHSKMSRVVKRKRYTWVRVTHLLLELYILRQIKKIYFNRIRNHRHHGMRRW